MREFVWLSWHPSRGFSITPCPRKSLLFSLRDEQSSQSISKTVLAVKVRGRSSVSVPHGGCARVGGCAGFHMKEPHCNAASFKSAQLEVPQGLGAVTQGKRPHLAPVSGTRCIWRGRNGLEMLVWSCWRGNTQRVKALPVPRGWMALLPGLELPSPSEHYKIRL